MRYSDLLRRSGRNLKQAKARTFLTAAAIGVGTFALTLTLAASNGAQAFVDNIIKDNFDPAELIVAADDGVFGRGDTSKPQEYDENFGQGLSNAGALTQFKRLSEDDINKIKALPSTDRVREGVTLNLLYITRPDQKKYVATVDSFNPAQKPDLSAGAIPASLKGGQVMLPESYVSILGFDSAEAAIGQTINLAVRRSFTPDEIAALLASGVSQTGLLQSNQNSIIEKPFKIVAVTKKPLTAQPGTEKYLFIDIEDAKILNDITTKGTADFHRYSYAFVRVKGGENETTLSNAQTELKNLGYVSQSIKETQEFLNRIIQILQGIVAAFGAIAVIASVFGIVNTMYISVLQRTREIGLMKALGMRRRDVGRLFSLEASWIGFIGGIIGSFGAYLLGMLLNPWISDKLDLGSDRLLIYKFPQIAVLILILVVIANLAGFFPSRKAVKLDPIEALRTE